ncbi:MAG: DUF357 domain-containing protein [Candidatus Micrarchaeaceae archaeon]
MEPDSTVKRIEKDISMFDENVANVKPEGKAQERVVELSKMYAKDARSYLDKGDLFTAFSCVSYAHGLLDAIKEITQK